MTELRIGRFYSSCPKPSNNFQLFPNILLQIRTFLCHFFSYFHIRIEMTDALLRFLAHPITITTDIFR